MATKTKARQQRKAPVVTVTLAKFDTVSPYAAMREAEPVGSYRPLGISDYSPRGGTPLRDATARFIAHLRELRSAETVTIGVLMDESGSMGGLEQSVVNGVNEFVAGMASTEASGEASGTVLAVIFTDGYENSSREVDAPSLQKMIASAEAEGFTFIYLGANQDAWAVGHATGFSGNVSGQTVNYASTPKGTAAALMSVTADAAGYLASPAQYATARATSSNRTIAEDGSESVAPQGQVVTSAGSSVEDALKTARRVTSR